MKSAKNNRRSRMDIINGSSFTIYEVLGAHPLDNGKVNFAVWAPHAASVSLVGTFNAWQRGADPMHLDYDTGIWEVDRTVSVGSLYKYCINDRSVFRADPLAFYTERVPDIASVVVDLDGYVWNDHDWIMKRQDIIDIRSVPMSIYELHLGGWKRPGGVFPSFRMIVDDLIDYVTRHGYNYVELLPVTEHRPYESWGYQTTGYFAPTSYYGTPTASSPNGTPYDFMFFVDKLHQAGIGVVFDWAPTHFSRVQGGLELFDGSHLYENSPFDTESQHMTIWTSPPPGTLYFNFRNGPVRSFLNSVMPFWVEKYHVDGFRLDALFGAYHIYQGKDSHGKDIFQNNYAGVSCIKQLNHTIHSHYKNVFTASEGCDRANMTGSLEDDSRFDFKWNMGWHNDILEYLSQEVHTTEENYKRLVHIWEFSQQERHILELSHDDEPTPRKLKGDAAKKRDLLKLLFTYLFTFPGKKLIFMGRDFAQTDDWSIFHELDWSKPDDRDHAILLNMVTELNRYYKELSALHANDMAEGFRWIERDDPHFSVIAFLRHDVSDSILVVFNFSDVECQHTFKNLVPSAEFERFFSTDSSGYGGSNGGTTKIVGSNQVLTLPPLSGMLYRMRKG